MCEYCETAKSIHTEEDKYVTADSYILKDEIVLAAFSRDSYLYDVTINIPIEYCPMCGRKLGGDE